MKVALAQLGSTTSKDENLKKVMQFMKTASAIGAEAIVFPEYTNLYAERDLGKERLYDLAETEDSEFIRSVKKEAREKGLNVIIGVYERGKAARTVYSSAFVINRSGEVVLKYRKSHIYEALGFSEASLITSSSDVPPVFDLEGTRFGLMICYEIRFPEIARSLALRNAEAVVVPAAWYRGPGKEDQWITLAKARALENTVYLASANQIAGPFTGITLAVDPMGVLVSRATEEEGIVMVDIDKERLIRARKALPVLKQRRPELYTGLT